ncbi:MAG: LacI family DNA-binding transcriptional regulator [Fimbriimonas sp.]
MRKRPSSIDVARLAEVSQATVSYVLSNRTDKSITDATRARVIAAADQLGYTPNRLADGILRGKSSTIGVLLGYFDHSFYSQLLMGLEEGFTEQNYQILIAHTRSNVDFGRQQVRMLMEHRVDGIIAIADESTVAELPGWAEDAMRHGVHLGIIDDLRMAGKVDTVLSDDFEGGRIAVDHLVAAGHQRIAFLGGAGETSSAKERYRGYCASLTAHGIEPDPDYTIPSTFLGSKPDIEKLLALRPAPTAVFAMSDSLACRVIIATREHGLRVPEDLAVVGYGNPEWADYMGLTSLDQHPHRMGQAAATRLVARIQGDESEPQTEVLAPVLIARNSTRA